MKRRVTMLGIVNSYRVPTLDSGPGAKRCPDCHDFVMLHLHYVRCSRRNAVTVRRMCEAVDKLKQKGVMS